MEHATTFDQRKPMEEVVGGSATEGIGGAIAIVLAILGLIGIIPLPLASIAAILLGISLMAGGATIASQYSKFLTGVEGYTGGVVGGGMTMEALCGFAGGVLGLLALLRIADATLLAVSVIIFGGALLMASGATARLNAVRMQMATTEPARAHEFARAAVYAASGSEILIGVAAGVLGILALSGFWPTTLILVAMLSVGASVLLSGTSVAGRMLSALPR